MCVYIYTHILKYSGINWFAYDIWNIYVFIHVCMHTECVRLQAQCFASSQEIESLSADLDLGHCLGQKDSSRKQDASQVIKSSFTKIPWCAGILFTIT